LWSWANTTTRIIDNVNTISAIYGGKEIVPNRLSLLVWVSLIVLAVSAVLYIAAYPGTKAKKKSGWNLLFYAALLNFAYGVVNAFTDYGTVMSLIGTLIGTIIGLFFLFQIRSYYTGSTAKAPAKKKK
jgi:predicted neutral ceramidase superfamily lipid hydrolase